MQAYKVGGAGAAWRMPHAQAVRRELHDRGSRLAGARGATPEAPRRAGGARAGASGITRRRPLRQIDKSANLRARAVAGP